MANRYPAILALITDFDLWIHRVVKHTHQNLGVLVWVEIVAFYCLSLQLHISSEPVSRYSQAFMYKTLQSND